MNVALAIGAVFCLVGLTWLLNVFAAGDYIVRHLTSRYLGSLPPGFAATRRGFRIYCVLIIALGVLFAGLGVAERSVPLAAGLLVIGAIAFGITSMLAITGEIETARAQRARGRALTGASGQRDR